jgi:hypothetical protein
VYVGWFAFYDPMVTVQYYETASMKFTPEAKVDDPYYNRNESYAHRELLHAVIFIPYENDFWEINGRV